jgi:ribosomal protein S21
MNKKEKRLLAQLPGGIGAIVTDGDLGLAIRVWKQDLKNSGIIKKLYDKKEYTKPSIERKQILEKAKHRNKFLNQSQK